MDEYTRRSQGPNVGMRKTKLMQIAEDSGDTGMMNPRSIDPLMYMLADKAETAFGPDLIERCRGAIALSNSGFPKKASLEFLTDRMVRGYVPLALSGAGKGDEAKKLSTLPPLNKNSYVDYFMSVSTIERAAFRTPVATAVADMVKMIASYETEQPGPVCDAIVDFFKLTKNPKGMEELIRDFGVLIKKPRK